MIGDGAVGAEPSGATQNHCYTPAMRSGSCDSHHDRASRSLHAAGIEIASNCSRSMSAVRGRDDSTTDISPPLATLFAAARLLVYELTQNSHAGKAHAVLHEDQPLATVRRAGNSVRQPELAGAVSRLAP